MAHKQAPFVVMLGLALGSSLGCARMYPLAEAPEKSYFAVHYKVRAENEPRAVFEVKQADKFPSLRSTWNNAALRAPEHCTTESANKGTGAGAGKNVKLMTNCGFWLSELERVLVQSKFTVASWSALSDLERTKQVPAYVAARDLGADVVFVINSLENEYVKLGKNSRESFDVYEADTDGHAFRRLAIQKSTFDSVRSFVRTRIKPLTKEYQNVTTHLTATLDITAVDTKTGEAVWFYRKQEVKAQPLSLDRYFLFARTESSLWPAQPHAFALAEREEERAARSNSDLTDHDSQWIDFKAPPENAQAEEANALSRAVVADFLTRFRGG